MIQYIDFMNLFYVYFVYIYSRFTSNNSVKFILYYPNISDIFFRFQASMEPAHSLYIYLALLFLVRRSCFSNKLYNVSSSSFFFQVNHSSLSIYLFFFLLSILYSTCSIIFQAVPEICSRGIYAIIKLLNNFVFLLISSYKIESNLIAVGFCDYACSVLFLVQIFKFYENNQICKLYGIFENLEKIYLLRFFVCATVVLSLLPPLSFAHYSYQTWLIASLCSCAVIHICYSMWPNNTKMIDAVERTIWWQECCYWNVFVCKLNMRD